MKQPFYSTLGGKIAMIFFAGFVLVLLPINIVVYNKLKSSLLKADEQLLKAETENLIPQIKLDPIIVPLPPLGYAVHIQVTDGVGAESIFMSPKFPDIVDQMYFLEVIELDTMTVLNTRMQIYDGSREMIVSVAKSNTVIENQMKEFRLYMFYLTGGVIFVIGFLIFFLTRIMLQPLRNIITTAEGISASETMRRLPIPASNDETKQLSLALNNMLERIEKSLNAQLQFFDSATHELKTPLAVMKTQLSYTINNKEFSPEAIQSTLEEVERLERTISDFLLLSQLRSESLVLRIQQTDLSEMVFAGISNVKGFAETHKTTFKVNQDNSSYPVQVDKDKIQTVLFNLLENSVNHSSPGAVVSINLERNGDQVAMTIENSTSQSVADPETLGFRRYKGSLSTKGMGLGLWIARQIMELHDADFEIQVEDGRFRVRFAFDIQRSG